MCVAAGADIVDLNMGCPVRKVTKTSSGASLLERRRPRLPHHGSRRRRRPVPVTVKLRRGVRNGSRSALELGPRLVDAGAMALTLHPRSAVQMYTGEADHTLTAELVSLVDVPVFASGDITSRARAQAVLATTGATAVMIGRGVQGNPWLLRELLEGHADVPTDDELAAEIVRFVREVSRELGIRSRCRMAAQVLRVVPARRTARPAHARGARDVYERRRRREAVDRRGTRCGLVDRALRPRDRRAR